VLQGTCGSGKQAHTGVLNGPGSSGLKALSRQVGSDGNLDRKKEKDIGFIKNDRARIRSSEIPLMVWIKLPAWVGSETGWHHGNYLSSQRMKGFLFLLPV